MIGRTLDHYTIVEKIGAGGMGEVYRATDTKLGRDVALKILPPEFARDTERMSRFEQEARVLASLNHPGIAAIFGIEEADGVRFLAMELVEGEDLSRRLERGHLSVPETLGFGRQVAEALEEAHARGIVHRDLKPANITLSGRGKVKVLDFGLAKPVAPPDPENSPTLALTGESVILGTAAYMSPEQARGHAVDTRTDVWAFGCVLWECLTGKALFARETVSDTIAAILHTEPEWSRLPAGTPPGVRRVLRRCLVKDPDRRLHHIADARIELEDAGEGVDAAAGGGTTGSAAVSGSAARWRTAAWVLLAALAAAVAGLIAVGTGTLGGRTPSGAGEHPLAGARFTRLTNFPGDEFEAAVSPDGQFVAFVSDRDGPFGVLVGQIGAGTFRNLTAEMDAGLLEDVRAPVRSVGFTRDGSGIWFGGGTGHRLRSVSLMGGPLRNLLGDKVVNTDWSPDGSRVAYHLRTAGDPVYVADADGANATLILHAEAGFHQHYPMWSPDGQWIYLSRGRAATGEMDLWRVRPDGTGLRQLTWDLRFVTYPTPLDAHNVLFCAQEADGAGPWLWSLDVEAGVPRRVSFGLEHYATVAASADGRRIVATVENPQAGLWRVPVLNRIATEADVEPFPVPTVRALAPRFGGGRFFYLSSRGSGDGLWSFHDGESTEIWKGSEAPLLEAPAVSPDGKSVALVLREQSWQRLNILSADGAERHPLTDAIDVRGSMSWSPDGRWIAVCGTLTSGEGAGEKGLFKVPLDGGRPRRIAAGEGLSPVWSPAGDLIVYTGPQVQAVSPLLGVTPEGDPVELPEIMLLREWGGERMRFLPDGSGLVYMRGLGPSQDFWLMDLATLESRQLTRFSDKSEMYTFDITPDGSAIIFDRLRRDSDLVLIERGESEGD